MRMIVENLSENFIWITSIFAGFATLYAIFRALFNWTKSPAVEAILGRWYAYAYFQSADQPEFYKEVISIFRHRIFPWKLELTAVPVGSEDVTKYRGWVKFHQPFVYISCYEPVYGDRTFEIFRRHMDRDHGSDKLIGIHLGRTYEEHLHSATPIIMVRRELDRDASVTKLADPDREEEEFKKIVGRCFSVETDSLQLLLT